MPARESVGRLRPPTWSGPEGSSHNGLRRVGRLLFSLSAGLPTRNPSRLREGSRRWCILPSRRREGLGVGEAANHNPKIIHIPTPDTFDNPPPST